MKRFHNFAFYALVLSTLLLQACGGGGGYSSSEAWEYKDRPAIPASDEPSNIAGPDAEIPVGEPAMAADMGMSAAPANLPPVKVGILLPLSGQNANLGQAMLNAAQLAMFEIGHNSFELLPRDTAGTSSGAREAAQSAINDGAQLLLGPVFADAVRGAKPVARSNGINMIAYSTDWTLGDTNTYIMGILPFDQVERVMYYASSKGVKNVGVFSPANSYGDAVVNAYNKISYKAGLNTVATKRFSGNASAINVEMRDFAQHDQRQAQGGQVPAPYDAIFLPAGGDVARTAASFASQYGMSPREVKRLGTGLWDDETLARDQALAGAWFAAPSPDLRREFERKYFETYAVSPPRIATLAYDSTALAAVLARSGLQRDGRPAFDGRSIQNPNGFSGVDGIFRFRQGGLVDRGLAVLEINSGRIRIIDPAPRTFQQRGF